MPLLYLQMSGCDATQYAAITTLFPDTNISAALCSATALQNAGVDLKNATTGNTAAISSINAWQMDIAYGVDSGWLITCGAMVFISCTELSLLALALRRRYQGQELYEHSSPDHSRRRCLCYCLLRSRVSANFICSRSSNLAKSAVHVGNTRGPTTLSLLF